MQRVSGVKQQSHINRRLESVAHAQALDLLRSNNCVIGLTVIPGVARLDQDNLLLLNRFDTTDFGYHENDSGFLTAPIGSSMGTYSNFVTQKANTRVLLN